MPLSDELLDERVRRSLEDLRTGPIDVPAAAGIVRRRAATRSRRRRAAAGFGAVALIAGVWAVALQADGRAKVDTEPAQTTETTTGEYGFSPVTPLLDEPLGDVPRTVLAEVGAQTFSADIVGGRLGMQLGDGVSSGSSSGDQMYASALDVSSTLPPAKGSSLFLTGATRTEVARVELAFGDRPVVTQPTISVAAFPTIRFFIFEVPPVPEVGLLDQPYVISAYDAEGRLLTDSDRVAAATDDFQRAMDERAGVEVRQAGILDVRPSTDTTNGMALRVFACGGEPTPIWTEAADAVRVSVNVKLPAGVGDCSSGDTVESLIELQAPLGDRPVIDTATGDEVPRRP
jgi:hypothetical protein